MATNTRKLASLLGASGAGIADDGTLTSTAIGEVIVASDIAAGAVGSSEIAADAVGASELADNAVGAGAIAADAIPVKPHIQPGVLYPAVANKMLDGTTALSAVTTGPNGSTITSSKYGTVQSDGRMYYYTDFKGSKPIKDPRIGAHYGSQRFPVTSMQLLEQETAAYGANVYSIDGRDWMRVTNDGDTNLSVYNNNDGVFLYTQGGVQTGTFIEVTGYFNDVNISQGSNTNSDQFRVVLDGGTAEDTDLAVAYNSILKGNRYVNSGSLVNLTFDSTPSLGIHTLRFTAPSASFYFYLYSFELIVQDTTSTATKSQIQIPAQNVVSYGKKFTVSGTPHYNPFAFKTDGSTAWTAGNHNGTAWPVGTGSSTNIDTATSLGLDAWVSTNYYYPYNGGRVVKWVASDGTIKTSVNMMPPNARSMANSASLTNGTEKGDDSAGTTSAAVANNTVYPSFTDQAIDQSQAEVAKSFHWREFGNGSANKNTASGTAAQDWADASMGSSTYDMMAYVMDDGLSGFFMTRGRGMHDTIALNNWNGDRLALDSGDTYYITFIGTGISVNLGTFSGVNNGQIMIAQNLPYGTHIVSVYFQASPEDMKITVDGVQVYSVNEGLGSVMNEMVFFQPKMPPIPENAVVLADYMLMADYKPQEHSVQGTEISKGIRLMSATRDVFWSGATGGAHSAGIGQYASNAPYGMGWFGTGAFHVEYPFFGTQLEGCSEGMNGATSNRLKIDGSLIGSHGGINSSFADKNDICFMTSASAIGLHKSAMVGTGTGMANRMGFATGIHTSHHYQSFETPFLNELVGGDRNMEQTNLVVTSDGKTWDEVTRDTSYIGNIVVSTTTGDDFNSSVTIVWDDWRGRDTANNATFDLFNKDFAIGYNRLICLRDGEYEITVQGIVNDNAAYSGIIYKNGVGGAYLLAQGYSEIATWHMSQTQAPAILKRGDFLIIEGEWWGDTDYSRFWIKRVS